MQNILRMVLKNVLTFSTKTVWCQWANNSTFMYYIGDHVPYIEQYMAENKVIWHLVIECVLSVCEQWFVSSPAFRVVIRLSDVLTVSMY